MARSLKMLFPATGRLRALRSRDAARRKCRPGLEDLEVRLPPNNLGALGELIGAATAPAASTRPSGLSGDTPAAASAAAVSRASQAAASAATVASPATAAAAPASERSVGAPAGPTSRASSAREGATGAVWDAGLIDLSINPDPSDEFAPSSSPRATPLGGGGGALPGRGGSPLIASAPIPAPAPPPAPAFTGPAPGFGWSGGFTAAPRGGTAPAPTPAPATAAPQQESGSITGFARQISLGGTTTLAPPVMGQPGGSDTLRSPTDPGGDASGSSGGDSLPAGQAPAVTGASVAPANPNLVTSFDGLNAYQQRYANGGNQFDSVPPDQGLAVGNGDVVEAVNCVLQVYNTAGQPLTGVEDLNTFFGYPAQINRTTGAQGPILTDPSAYFDQPTQRWFVDVLTIEIDPSSGAFLGPNHIDIAVSQTADPTGGWNIYRLPIQDDGTQGTPNHAGGGFSGPFLGDYPHIGADRNGIYITTNEFDLSKGFRAAQVYALPKAALTSGAATVPVVQFDTIDANLSGYPGFTLIPSLTPGSSYAGGHGGTEYFLSSSDAPFYNATGSDNVLGLWSMTDTQSLNTPNPSPSLSYTVLNVNPYTLVPASAVNQKAGDFPLGEALNNPADSRELFGTTDPYAPEVESTLENMDTRMTQVTYADGKLWGAIDTAVTVGGRTQAGIEWFVISPNAGGSGRVDNQGYLSLAGNNLIFPAIAVTQSGKGVMGFSVAGNDYDPSAAYATIDATSGVGDIHIAADGAGPEDAFADYMFFGGYISPRFGDYAAAVADGNTIWVGNEYIGNAGTLDQFMADPTLGGTRTALANWDTRLTQVKVQ